MTTNNVFLALVNNLIVESEEKSYEKLDTETLVSVQLEGFEILEKTVKSSGNSGRVYLPAGWIGSKVKIVRLTPKLQKDEE